MKVNLELLRDAREIRQAETISEDRAELLGKADIIWKNHPIFCDKCGETDPENGFYPGSGFTVYAGESRFSPIARYGSLSGLPCNDCDKQMRVQTKD